MTGLDLWPCARSECHLASSLCLASWSSDVGLCPHTRRRTQRHNLQFALLRSPGETGTLTQCSFHWQCRWFFCPLLPLVLRNGLLCNPDSLWWHMSLGHPPHVASSERSMDWTTGWLEVQGGVSTTCMERAYVPFSHPVSISSCSTTLPFYLHCRLSLCFRFFKTVCAPTSQHIKAKKNLSTADRKPDFFELIVVSIFMIFFYIYIYVVELKAGPIVALLIVHF